MKYFSKRNILESHSNFRRHLINSLSGYKSANLIGTLSPTGRSNLALFSSAVHIGATPPLIGVIMRPLTVQRQTYDYIKESGKYTLNHVHKADVAKAHYTSAKFDENTSEFAQSGLQEEYLDDWPIPYVASSRIKMGLSLVEELVIKSNNTILLVGAIEHVYVESKALKEDGNIDLSIVEDVAISGLETYYEVQKFHQFAYARPGQPPLLK